MYEIPSLTGCKTCTVSEETITKGTRPVMTFEDPQTLPTKKEIA